MDAALQQGMSDAGIAGDETHVVDPAIDDACAKLSEVAERVAEEHATGRAFLGEFARQSAAIRPGLLGFFDLAYGGRDLIRGDGFQPRFHDGTTGQARHFAGVAYAVALFGARPTRVLSIRIRRDRPDSADGLLTDAAIDFATGLLDGSLPPSQAAAWIRDHLCHA
jgi:hypothetical protein